MGQSFQPFPDCREPGEPATVRSDEHAATRYENDVSLLPQLDDIRCGKAVDALARFAKAYLGMFLEIDNSLPPCERVYELVNDSLGDAVLAGFVALLNDQRHSGVPQIAATHLAGDSDAAGFVILAGADLIARRSIDEVLALPNATLEAALAYSVVNNTYESDRWVVPLLVARPAVVRASLGALWDSLTSAGASHLPALSLVLREAPQLGGQLVLPVLQRWHNFDKRTLRWLLLAALAHADRAQLAVVAAGALTQQQSMELRCRLYWLATAFLVAPQEYGAALAGFAGRSKEKILPLLDFSLAAMSPSDGAPQRLAPTALGQLIRIVAPKFPPQRDGFGDPCDNTLKVLRLFYQLAESDGAARHRVVQDLRDVRVMRTWFGVLDYVAQLQRLQAGDAPSMPGFEAFTANLKQDGRLLGKRTWFDSRPH
ncbi:MAG: hypothetical protein JSW10_05050 [Pseudomonadota bacterium]|nr:MAG: hypothetical protein JSW10_05050 [Pseudomonadota bacterium]